MPRTFHVQFSPATERDLIRRAVEDNRKATQMIIHLVKLGLENIGTPKRKSSAR